MKYKQENKRMSQNSNKTTRHDDSSKKKLHIDIDILILYTSWEVLDYSTQCLYSDFGQYNILLFYPYKVFRYGGML